jgi:branched-chain amino acid transport system ATP-binding protein
VARRIAVNVLDIDHLNCAFGNLVVTDDVSLSIAEGERHVIIGPNGAGKTSLINQIGGQLRPKSGRIFVNGQDITANRRPGSAAWAWRGRSSATTCFTISASSRICAWRLR